MTNFTYALMSPDGKTVLEFRTFSDFAPPVGPNASGDFAHMVPATADQLAALAALAAPPAPTLDVATLAAALITKNVIAQGDLTTAIQADDGATLSASIGLASQSLK